MRFLLPLLFFATGLYAQDRPNILLIIADDLGVDRLRGYHDGNLMATTPTLDSLRAVGITFLNATAAPVCSPTRAALMTGKYGVKTGVVNVPGTLDPTELSLFDALAAETGNAYADALIGKWHLTTPANPSSPLAFGMDEYDGFLRGAVDDFYAWARTTDGQTTTSNEYVTTVLTDRSLNWIGEQTDPWFLWLAHAAPHTPYHVPPAGTFSVPTTDNNIRKYVAMVEALDYEMGRLLAELEPDVRNNTLVIFVGDNGTPNNVMQDYPDGHGKGSLYQGGIRVPLIIAGKGVTRPGAREMALVHVTDLHATILEAAGAELPGGVFNGLSFYELLGNDAESAVTRDYNYVDQDDGWAIRNERYKLIEQPGGSREFYDLRVDSFEVNNLLAGQLSDEETASLDDLAAEAVTLRSGWSCRDHIQNGAETGIDCGTDACGICTTSTTEVEEEHFRLYPNPFSGSFNIWARSQVQGEVVISDAAGKVLLRQTGIGSVNAKDLPAGIYRVDLRAEGASKSWLVVKR